MKQLTDEYNNLNQYGIVIEQELNSACDSIFTYAEENNLDLRQVVELANKTFAMYAELVDIQSKILSKEELDAIDAEIKKKYNIKKCSEIADIEIFKKLLTDHEELVEKAKKKNFEKIKKQKLYDELFFDIGDLIIT
jgi:hypothetical protein